MSHAKNLPIPPRTDTGALIVAWGTPIDPELVALTLAHRSYASEVGGTANSECLEFLSDAVLSIVTADRLFHGHPDPPKSDLSRMRVATVSREPFAMAARCIELGNFTHLGRGEVNSGGRSKGSTPSDTFEATIGMTYLTGGFKVARHVILESLDSLLVQTLSRGSHHGWRTLFVERTSQLGFGEVSYEIEGKRPDRDRAFIARTFVSSEQEPIAGGKASSRKHAEMATAGAAMSVLAELWIH